MKIALRFAVSLGISLCITLTWLGIACVPLGLLVGGIIKSCVDDKKVYLKQ